MAGVYGFGRGLFVREPLAGTNTTYKFLHRLHTNDFVVSQPKGWEGALARVTASFDGRFLSPVFPTFRANPERLDIAYLDWYCKQPKVWEELRHKARGIGARRESVLPAQFLSLEIPLPSLAEQRSIVARIEELAAKIEEARGLRREAVTETESLLSAGSRAIASSLAGVTSRPIRDFVIVQSGGTPSKGNPFFWDGSIPWVSPKDMKSREIYDSADHISEAAILNSAAKLLAPGCVLVVVRGMILAHTVPAAVLRVEATINQDIKALLPTDDLLPEYLCSSLWAFNKDLLGLVEKSTHDTRRFETHKLLDFNLPVPPLEEQRRIVVHLDTLQAKVDALKKLQAETAAELDALLPSILDKAFKGEL